MGSGQRAIGRIKATTSTSLLSVFHQFCATVIIMKILIVVLLVSSACCQQQNYPRQNAPLVTSQPKLHVVDLGDGLAGSYKFAFDTGKTDVGQIFRQEKRLEDGTVIGKYGYVDANGKQRIVSYRAGKNGFEASGDTGPDKNGPPGPGVQQPQQQQRQRPRRPAPRPQQQRPQPPVYRPPPPQPQPPRRQNTIPQQYIPRQPQYGPRQPQYAPRQPQYAPRQPQYVPRQRVPQYIPRQQQQRPQQQLPPPQAPQSQPAPNQQQTEPYQEPDYGPPVIPTHLLSYGYGSAYTGKELDAFKQ